MDEDEAPGDDDGMDVHQDPPHCMGHRFHWSEIFFTLTTLFGVVLATGAVPVPAFLALAIYTAAAAIACMLTWNLVSIKRIAAATDLLVKDVRKFKAENARARNLQGTLKEQDAQMKSSLAELEKAELLLKGSVTGLEDVEKQENEMMEERTGLLEHRREIAGKLLENMKKLWRLTIDQAQEEVHKRAIMLYDDVATVQANGEEAIKVGSPAWKMLGKLLTGYSIDIDREDLHSPENRLSVMAGEDGQLSYEEFMTWLESHLEHHFEKLEVALSKCEELQEELRVAGHASKKRKRRATVVANLSSDEVKISCA